MASHSSQPVSSGDRGLEVISESDRNPGVRTVRVRRTGADDVSFLPAAVKGLGITLKHFATNFFRRRKNNDIETIQYPEEKLEYPERNRGLHRLMTRDDDTVRCVACMCCPTVCPAHCITIIPAETDDKGVEKYPAVVGIPALDAFVTLEQGDAVQVGVSRKFTADGIATLASLGGLRVRSMWFDAQQYFAIGELVRDDAPAG